jgi:hypothetical protein
MQHRRTGVEKGSTSFQTSSWLRVPRWSEWLTPAPVTQLHSVRDGIGPGRLETSINAPKHQATCSIGAYGSYICSWRPEVGIICQQDCSQLAARCGETEFQMGGGRDAIFLTTQLLFSQNGIGSKDGVGLLIVSHKGD